jgi:hypothetical protein
MIEVRKWGLFNPIISGEKQDIKTISRTCNHMGNVLIATAEDLQYIHTMNLLTIVHLNVQDAKEADYFQIGSKCNKLKDYE